MTTHRRNEQGRLLLLAIQASPKDSGRLLGEALDDPAQRKIVVPYLAAYLADCAQGFVPNLDRWRR